ncbi:MAG: 4-hydroxy-tetrahydrodipicolinate synthase [Alphaproteobacteria bacterium]|nr:4-hydroxy-tetrahydrodipicolinate synthase [Alphaproteobacteria bacterium]
MFYGSITALITPFKDGEIDWSAYENLIEWQIENGTHGLVPCGTTGESPTLSHEEHLAILKRCVDVVKGRIPVIAGTGSNNTSEALSMTKYAKEIGADAALIVTPYYNKPTQDGMFAHYATLHNEANFPIVIYNIPGRSVVDMSVETMTKLAKLPNIIGVKDAAGDLSRPLQTRHAIGPDFCQLSGDDITAAAFLAQGGVGCVSVVSNIAPKESADMQNAWRSGDMETFNTLRDKLLPLARDLFCESNPAPVKYAAQTLGICSDEVRLPLIPASKQAREKVDAALAFAGIKVGASARAA